jgi:hypothetical protein
VNADRFQSLLDRHFDQLLTAAERDELSALLMDSAGARGEFWRQARWHGLMRQWGEAEAGRRVALAAMPMPARRLVPRKLKVAERTSAPLGPARVRRTPRMRWLWPLAAAAALALAVMRPDWNAMLVAARNIFGIPSAEVAAITHSAGAEWLGRPPARAGEGLGAGWLRLARGAVQLDFPRGARVVLVGPAEMRLVDGDEVFLRRGMLRARVPAPARGFTVRTKEFDAVDLGTEFGVSAPEKGAVELHVFKGLVTASAPDLGSQELRAGEAVSVLEGKDRAIRARGDLFLSEGELARRELAIAKGRYAEWREAGEWLDHHAGAMLRFDFEQADDGTPGLPNLAPAGGSARVIDCAPAEGRWPGKGALDFRGGDARLRGSLPDEMRALTLLAWVRVDALPAVQSSLIMSGSESSGAVHWYARGSGELGLAIIAPDGKWTVFQSPPVLRGNFLRRWVCVAATFERGVARLYFNGRQIAERRLGAVGPLRLGTFDIGNWPVRPGDPLKASLPIHKGCYERAFCGRMDEFAILSEALTPAEIARFYEQTRPLVSMAQTARNARDPFLP